MPGSAKTKPILTTDTSSVIYLEKTDLLNRITKHVGLVITKQVEDELLAAGYSPHQTRKNRDIEVFKGDLSLAGSGKL
ncbi:MAG: hypothetical protein JXA42_24195, partial [Anaerolineales bacterium]|nr:hypothetical protein [Anaerolineales bacterium]